MRKVRGSDHTNPTAVNHQKKMNLHLKKGALHAEMGLKPKAHISLKAEEKEKAKAKKTGNTKLEERVQFAINARKWHHGG